MARILIYFAHPGRRYSRANMAMAEAVDHLAGVTFVDLYGQYPRHDIEIEAEQAQLIEHDVIIFQFPLFWYSTPSLLKEWMDLVLEHGFAYGSGGEALKDKIFMCAVTASSPEDAYSPDGFQNYPLRTFLTPLEQTARLCQMRGLPPYVLYESLVASEDERLPDHVKGYKRLIMGLREERYDCEQAGAYDVIQAQDLKTLLRDEETA
ncbi:NAD(P)H-dependent oxidoreductase [Oceanicaulis sp.]|uniref:NAD(P)H-dependent oxidoreductase n=1 Tax=Oceanicaulis sp. TaxID=1924941 RepID=UPI003D2ADF7C